MEKVSREFSWFLGFLTTDGCINKPKYRKKGDETHISFCLHSKDIDVLHKIKEIIPTNSNVRNYPNYKTTPRCVLTIYKRKDITNKYYNIKDIIPSDVIMKDYIRGFVDGDGCLYYRKNRKTFTIDIVNTNQNILINIKNYIINKFGFPSKNLLYRSPVFDLRWEGKMARVITWWLYNGNIDNMVLSRKKNYYLKYLNVNNSSLIDEFLTAVNISYHYKNNGIVLDMNTPRHQTLNWCHIIQKILKNGTPIPLNKGHKKYYGLYFPVINTQSISFQEGMKE